MKINGWPPWLRVNDQLNATSLVAVVVSVWCISECVCNCRLIAQLHDELLYEVEDSQVEQFAGEFTTPNIS